MNITEQIVKIFTIISSKEWNIAVSSLSIIFATIWSVYTFQKNIKYKQKSNTSKLLIESIFQPFHHSIESCLFQKITKDNKKELEKKLKLLSNTISEKQLEFYLSYELIEQLNYLRKLLSKKKHKPQVDIKVQIAYQSFSYLYLGELNDIRRQQTLSKREFFYRSKKKLHYNFFTKSISCVFFVTKLFSLIILLALCLSSLFYLLVNLLTN